ncbi:hypothetical protein Syun_019603 [Stephania yunnanensis]|uniref:Late embryogenesis abundant protein LEA-2 subgroup domain-containing protein n=1 Tax=Stephania yunnanensis TaxID=152371 RepID=A0AAP0IUE8_9MAGN
MSEFHVSSPKHCAKKGFKYKKLLYTIFTLVTSLISLALLIWFIIHPTKPNFSLKETNIDQLIALSSSPSTPPQLLNSSIQLTLTSTNPNQKLGIYHDQLQIYASYKGQQLTSPTPLPSFYQGHQDSNVLTALLVGVAVPIGPSFVYEVDRDLVVNGALVVDIKASGRLRWKIGTWVSPRYSYSISCSATMAFPSGVNGGYPLSLKKATQCSTG